MKDSIKTVIVLTLCAVLSGAVLAWFNKFTEARVIENKLAELRKSLSEVVPGMSSYEEVVKERDFALYRVLSDGDVVGYAVEAQGNGYQDKIRVLVGVSRDLKRIYGLRVLEQKETPGLGARIVEPDYLAGWSERDATNPIMLVKGKNPEKPNEVHAITGATITSKAVVDIVNAGIARARTVVKGEGK
ncbi:RnfABCDGE type electron transport complex subunit G [Thermodesulforhabdus norvegica]|uniref:Ion-translocating oxidoreductase complex subunit G n=1 Tax=Thermodesulforhabdus norvegica TaxID=39841 RepID=A0A1I4R9V7_9BACT|nr:RnfABCDGE type electron transport complex subunit G [Thermodesulforhabdus norvegica]SFM48683.1 electron transport complex protein RnfG [Thermodesulforhabdus norvegica]